MPDPDVREIAFSSRHTVELRDHPIPDIDRDPLFTKVFEASRSYSMTSKDTMFSLYQAVRYVVESGIPGDFVECGVWRGGSALLAGLAFRELGDTNRVLRLYDTFKGMTTPGEKDVDIEGGVAANYIDRFGDDGRWCCAEAEAVRSVFIQNEFDMSNVKLIVGDVSETLKSDVPACISVLRLDTDWYASTKLELEVLYPRLAKGGVLIIDDYGHWHGAKAAVDEYFSDKPRPFLQRTTYAVRTGVKV